MVRPPAGDGADASRADLPERACPAVGRSGGDGVAADYSLDLDIRTFELDVKALQADVEIAAKILEARSGRVVAARVFKAQAPAAGTSGPKAAAALDAALSKMMGEIVAFASAKI